LFDFFRPAIARALAMIRAAKPFPRFTTDAETEAFVANADLTQYDFSRMVPMRFELKPAAATGAP
jgi:hypothetical protein